MWLPHRKRAPSSISSGFHPLDTITLSIVHARREHCSNLLDHCRCGWASMFGYHIISKNSIRCLPLWPHLIHCLQCNPRMLFLSAPPLQVWVGPLSGNRSVVALVNTGYLPRSISARWSLLGVPRGRRMEVRDLWQVSLFENGLESAPLMTMQVACDRL